MQSLLQIDRLWRTYRDPRQGEGDGSSVRRLHRCSLEGEQQLLRRGEELPAKPRTRVQGYSRQDRRVRILTLFIGLEGVGRG